jgi:hypothetical protein
LQSESDPRSEVPQREEDWAPAESPPREEWHPPAPPSPSRALWTPLEPELSIVPDRLTFPLTAGGHQGQGEGRLAFRNRLVHESGIFMRSCYIGTSSGGEAIEIIDNLEGSTVY